MTYFQGDELCKSLNTKLLQLKSEEENVGAEVCSESIESYRTA